MVDFNDYQGYSEEQLFALASEKLEFRKEGSARWIYWVAEYYSFGKHIRNYAFYPSFLPLYCFTDHGAGVCYDYIIPFELENDAPIQFYSSPVSIEMFKNVTSKPCYPYMNPMVWYRRNNNITQSPHARGTLAFPVHEAANVENKTNWKEYALTLKALPEEMQPVCVSIFYSDIQKGLHHVFLEHGIPVYTAGNAADQRFAERFYEMIRHFKYSTAHLMTSGAYYCVEMGIPFSLYGTPPVLVMNGESHLSKGVIAFNSKNYANFVDLFQGIHTSISVEQKQYVESSVGIYNHLTRYEMAKLLYVAYLKHGNFFEDFKFFCKTVLGYNRKVKKIR